MPVRASQNASTFLDGTTAVANRDMIALGINILCMACNVQVIYIFNINIHCHVIHLFPETCLSVNSKLEYRFISKLEYRFISEKNEFMLYFNCYVFRSSLEEVNPSSSIMGLRFEKTQ